MNVTEHIKEAERFAASAAEGKGSMYGSTHATLALAHATIAIAKMKAES